MAPNEPPSTASHAAPAQPSELPAAFVTLLTVALDDETAVRTETTVTPTWGGAAASSVWFAVTSNASAATQRPE